jgi:hypothetical protein
VARSYYPSSLEPDGQHVFSIDGREVMVPKTHAVFAPWIGPSLQRTFNRKPIVQFDGRPMFAELAIRQLAEDAGWHARWVRPHGARASYHDLWIDTPGVQPKACIDDEPTRETLERIAARNNGLFTGCWDVFAWKGDQRLFMEAKHAAKDHLQKSQNGWLKAALDEGLDVDDFVVVEWSFLP